MKVHRPERRHPDGRDSLTAGQTANEGDRRIYLLLWRSLRVTRIVMFSAYPEYREQALTLGAHTWVTKSTGFRQLLAALRPEPSTGP